MGSSLLYISIAYYMQKGGGWVQITCKIAYVLNGRPLYDCRIKSINSRCTMNKKEGNCGLENMPFTVVLEVLEGI